MDNDYQRQFFIFKRMDAGYGNGNPTGFVKTETRGGNTKLQLSLNNIASSAGMRYKLYGIVKSDSHFSYTNICDIPVINGRADIKLSVESDKVGSGKLNIGEINIYAVIALQNSERSSVICPLAAYSTGETEWKPQFDRLILAELKGEKRADTQHNLPSPPIVPEIQVDIFPLVETDNASDNISISNNTSHESMYGNPYENMHITEESAVEELPVHPAFVDVSAEETPAGQMPAGIYPQENAIVVETEEGAWEAPVQIAAEEWEQPLPPVDDFSEGFQEANEALNDLLESKEDEIAYADDISFSSIPSYQSYPQSLKEDLDNNFEKYHPFGTKSKKFKWWKINSPGYLNNVLFRNNIKTYLLFSPNIMLAHYKYKYIIFGLRSSRYVGKELLICGIPGIYGVDDNPFEGMGSWVQVEGRKARYGAFGYWVVMIDSKTGKLMKIK